MERPTHRRPLGVRVALLALRFYQAYLSLLFAGNCRFVPTCSEYSYEAIARFGLLRGCWMTLKRLARCQPFSGKFGYDPLSEAEEKHAGNPSEIPCADVTHQEVHS